MANPYTYGFDVYRTTMDDDNANRGRGPVGASPLTGARTLRGRAEEGAFQSGTIGAGGSVPWAWIGVGVLAVILLARR